MPFPLRKLPQIRDDMLAGMRNLDPDMDTGEASDNYIRSSGIASAVEGLYQYMGWGVNQIFPDTADLDNLQRFARARNIPIVLDSNAIGAIALTGVVDAEIPAGTIAAVSDGNQYRTTAIGTIDGTGHATVAAKALNAGVIGNQPNNMPCTLQEAPPGIDANATLLEMGGGAPAESVTKLLSRVLEFLRSPPAGGNTTDHVRWAMEVPGVTAAWCYPKRRGSGTVDIAVMSNGEPPTESLRIAVAAYVDGKAPPYGDRMIVGPEQIVIAVTASLVLRDDVLLSSVLALAEAALAEYFSTLKPGDTIYLARIRSIFTNIPGVIDYTVSEPAANVTTLVDATHVQIGKLGAVTLTES
ncbi:baseplate J/gp47 family protein [Herminiimonas arsenitoxidans]|uniref:baseplate J/gp47 family protein n=1 Tax=Herminiimonas arsenitoxidans TaxID=1809410 RepID=UPI00097134F4